MQISPILIIHHGPYALAGCCARVLREVTENTDTGTARHTVPHRPGVLPGVSFGRTVENHFM